MMVFVVAVSVKVLVLTNRAKIFLHNLHQDHHQPRALLESASLLSVLKQTVTRHTLITRSNPAYDQHHEMKDNPSNLGKSAQNDTLATSTHRNPRSSGTATSRTIEEEEKRRMGRYVLNPAQAKFADRNGSASASTSQK